MRDGAKPLIFASSPILMPFFPEITPDFEDDVKPEVIKRPGSTAANVALLGKPMYLSEIGDRVQGWN
jgi:hypothetical protein